MKAFHAILAFVCLVATCHAEIITAKNSKGAYYEVHRESDTTYTFYFVPLRDAAVTVYGRKGDRTVLGFYNLRSRKGGATTLQKEADKKGRVSDKDGAIAFMVDVSLVDELILEYRFMAAENLPSGINYETDLIWLIEESKRDHRFKDHTKKPNKETAQDNRGGG